MSQNIRKVYASMAMRHYHMLAAAIPIYLSWKKPENYTVESLQEKILSHIEHTRGPTGKLAQIIAEAHGFAPDVLRQALSFSFSGMLPGMKGEKVEKILRQELETKTSLRLEDIFSEIDLDNQKSASFGSVVKGVIKDTNMPVAIKVLYPGIEQIISRDILFMQLGALAGKCLNKLPFVNIGLAPDYAPRVLKEIKERCLEEADLRKEAINMSDSFNWYCELFTAVSRLDEHSKIRRALAHRQSGPISKHAGMFKSTPESVRLMYDFHFIHPVPYLEQHNRPDLCTQNVLVMDYIPGTDGSNISAADEKSDDFEAFATEEVLREHLAKRTEPLGLISMHPHLLISGEDSKEYAVHSDIHPGNVIIHCSPDPHAGICTGIVDFGNIQRLTFHHSRQMHNILENALQAGTYHDIHGTLDKSNRDKLAQAYVQAGIVDSIQNQDLDHVLIPFVLETTAPYRIKGHFDYSNREYFGKLNHLMWKTLFSPSINPKGNDFWTQRAMYLHANAMHRIGGEVNSAEFMQELRSL